MTDTTQKRVYLIYGIIQSLLLLAVAIGYGLACLRIYNGGKGIFSREAVTAAFTPLLIPTVLCLAGILTGIVLSLVYPLETAKPKGGMHPADAIKRLFPRLDKARCPAKLVLLMKSEYTHRVLLRTAATVLCVILAIPCLVHLLNPANFDDIGQGLTSDILAAMLFVLPAAALGLGIWIVTVFGCHASYRRELETLKEAVKAAPLKEKPDTAPKTKVGGAKLWILRGCVLALAVTFILLGIFNDGIRDVLQKAIRICTECIGLG